MQGERTEGHKRKDEEEGDLGVEEGVWEDKEGGRMERGSMYEVRKERQRVQGTTE